MPAQIMEFSSRARKFAREKQTVLITVLIIDDEESTIDFLKVGLERLGFRVISATKGKEGMRMAHEESPNLVLLDLHLPDMEGFAISESLADSMNTCTIPVIILSAMSRPDIIRSARTHGCRYYLRKPFDPNALWVLIQHVLDSESEE